jgi:mono/diheme cytochrome c family protein
LSSRSAEARLALVLLLILSTGSLGCWEQMSAEWFPQMKRQIAVQAFEDNTLVGLGQGLTPPEGSVPVGNPYPQMARLDLAAQEGLQNPVSSNLASLKKGEQLFQTYCVTCHGPEGHGDGPVAGPPFGKGPFGLVLPVGGPASVANAFSDGHIYTTITMGRGRMPSYRRIPSEGRWDLVNYIRDLNGRGGRQ